VPTFRFSTDDFPERDRLAAWRDIFGRSIVKLDVEPLPTRRFYSDTTLRPLPGLGLMHGACSGARLSLTKDLIDNDDLAFATGPIKGWAASQRGRDLVLSPGDAVLMSNAEVAAMVLPSGARFTTFRVPVTAIAPLVPDIGAVIGRRIPADSAALRLLIRYLGIVNDEHALATPELQRLAVTHVHDLLAVALGATRDAAEIARDRGLRAARLNAIKADILDHLHREDLAVTALARRHGVTPRYVQILFEAEGTTSSEFVRGRRLAHAHRVLTDLRHADRSVTDIAYGAGFGDLSHFNHAFRRLYGASPSDVRAGASRNEAMPAPGLASKRRNLWAGHDIFS